MKHKVVLLASMLVLGAIVAPGQGNIGMKSDSTAKKHMMMQMKKGRMKDGIMMKDGKMMMMKDGKKMAMDADMTMPNGTMVMKDGTCVMKDGTRIMMKEGDMIDTNGDMMKKGNMMKENKAENK